MITRCSSLISSIPSLPGSNTTHFWQIMTCVWSGRVDVEARAVRRSKGTNFSISCKYSSVLSIQRSRLKFKIKLQALGLKYTEFKTKLEGPWIYLWKEVSFFWDCNIDCIEIKYYSYLQHFAVLIIFVMKNLLSKMWTMKQATTALFPKSELHEVTPYFFMEVSASFLKDCPLLYQTLKLA